MTVYIKDFCFKKKLGKPVIHFKYFTGYDWKGLTVKNKFEKENVTVYTRYVLDCIIKDICGEEKDPIKRDAMLRVFESDVACVAQLNAELVSGATKIFN